MPIWLPGPGGHGNPGIYKTSEAEPNSSKAPAWLGHPCGMRGMHGCIGEQCFHSACGGALLLVAVEQNVACLLGCEGSPVGSVVCPLKVLVPIDTRPGPRQRGRLAETFEEGGVLRGGHLRDERWLLEMEPGEVHAREEGLLPDLRRCQALLPRADDARQEALRRRCRPSVAPRLAEALRQDLCMVQDFLLDHSDSLGALATAGMEWDDTGQALEADDANGPEVGLWPVFPTEALWRHVLRSAHDARNPCWPSSVAPTGSTNSRGGARLDTAAKAADIVCAITGRPSLAETEIQELQVA
mmetsp:Transcript_115664/g.299917  ORF Transcript_115664/g.299917 Transcript_115664/m.299917 type:complete len:299 (-) Transcript_115664:721-1617(-)